MIDLAHEKVRYLGTLVVDDNAALGLRIDSRYEVERRLGRGGMGEVFLAQDLRLNRPVAMKVLSAEVADPEWAARFQAEAQVLGQVEHPGIVPIHDLGTLPDGRLFYTMKFVAGRTFEDLPRDVLVEKLADVCDIVHHAHERGIVHRDLKPANLMVDEQGHVFVMDWGIARVMESSRQTQIRSKSAFGVQTVVGVVMGTPGYMSPEQVLGNVSHIGPRSDVYSLGAILYEILTGTPVVTETSLPEVIEATCRRDPARPRQADSSISLDLEAVCLRALAREPEKRYGSARELAEDLRRALRGDPVAARPVSWANRIGRKAKKHRALLIPAVATMLVAMALAGWSLSRKRSQIDDAEILLAQARVLEEEGRLGEARVVYQKILDSHPQDPRGSEGVIRIEAAQREKEEGQKARERFQAVQIGLQEAEALLYEEATTYEELSDRLDPMQQALERAASALPNAPEGPYLLGRVWELRGWEARAGTHWERALELAPGFGAARYRLARLLFFRHFLEEEETARLRRESLRHLEAVPKKAIPWEDELQPIVADLLEEFYAGDYGSFHRRLKVALETWGKDRRSADLYLIAAAFPGGYAPYLTEALRLRPHFPIARYMRGRMSWGKAPERFADLNDAVRFCPGFAHAVWLRGVFQPEEPKALADFEKALELRPGFRPAQESRDKLLKK